MSVEQEADMNGPGHPTDTFTIVRDALVMQGKLVIDGLRDALLIPVTLIAAIISLLQTGPRRGRAFYEAVSLGRRSERWINLFAAADRLPASARHDADMRRLDDYLAQVEEKLLEQYRSTDPHSPARRTVDALVERIRAARQRFLARRSGQG